MPLVPLPPSVGEEELAPVPKVPPFLVEEVARCKDVRRVQLRNHREGKDKDNPPERVVQIVKHVETACEHDDELRPLLDILFTTGEEGGSPITNYKATSKKTMLSDGEEDMDETPCETG